MFSLKQALVPAVGFALLQGCTPRSPSDSGIVQAKPEAVTFDHITRLNNWSFLRENLSLACDALQLTPATGNDIFWRDDTVKIATKGSPLERLMTVRINLLMALSRDDLSKPFTPEQVANARKVIGDAGPEITAIADSVSSTSPKTAKLLHRSALLIEDILKSFPGK